MDYAIEKLKHAEVVLMKKIKGLQDGKPKWAAAKQLEPMYMAAAKEVPGYAVFNLSASYKVNEHFSTFALWSNLLNTKYYEVWGYNTAPTNIQVGIRFQ